MLIVHNCQTCDLDFNDPKDLSRHILKKHEGIDMAASVSEDIDTDLDYETDVIHCKACNKHFTCARDFKRHNDGVHSGLRPFKCDVCDKIYSRLNNLNRHRTRKHDQKPGAASPSIIIPKLIKTLGPPPNSCLKKKTKATNTFKCAYCDSSFSSTVSLQMHTLDNHFDMRAKKLKSVKDQETEGKGHKCFQCSEKFLTGQILACHLLDEHSPDRWQVAVDDDSSFQEEFESFLKVAPKESNARGVAATNDYRCKYCGGKYYNLTRHIRAVHTKESESSCVECDKTFSDIHVLKRHMRTVHSKLDLKCKFCDKTYQRPDNLRRHIKADHEGKVKKCKLCGVTKKCKRGLMMHFQKEHNMTSVLSNYWTDV